MIPFSAFPAPNLRHDVRDATSGDDLGNLPEWDLTHLYRSEDSAELKRDLDWLGTECADFAAAYEGNLAGLSADEMLNCILRYEKIQSVSGRIMSFAGLRYYQITTDADRAKFIADMQGQITDFSTPLVFFSLEMNRVDDNILDGLLTANADLARYKPVLDRMRAMKPYQLSDEMEKFLHDQSVVGATAWNRLFDETCAALEFVVDGEVLNLEGTLQTCCLILIAKPAKRQLKPLPQLLAKTSPCLRASPTRLPKKKKSKTVGASCQHRSLAATWRTMWNPKWFKPCAMRLSPHTQNCPIGIMR